MKHEGFQVFRDDDEIERGECIKSELLKAIRNSRMSVIVLSKNYADSTACLFEAQTILELCKKSDHFVLPVFYEVEPWVLKEQSKKLVFEKKEVAAEKVKGWSAALNELATVEVESSIGLFTVGVSTSAKEEELALCYVVLLFLFAAFEGRARSASEQFCARLSCPLWRSILKYLD
ncbi:hypothetical protein RHGRI_032388 [Rhododendron griersonianum]|uniref:ADP-ribosyl cyclase/cyclic ADP-ribose hydrolase n=1 Tax=Rhododendron griersonianum TaxID=479676 RepID=A0AAV6IBQ1_9ERIC|nr:hypothetical protein RHGRI_032388 [Rhododendron griersonianum]